MVTTLALPAVLSLSFMPNLKSLSPVMAAGTILMILGFVSLGVVGGIEWADRPEPPKANPPQVPLAVCYDTTRQFFSDSFTLFLTPFMFVLPSVRLTLPIKFLSCDISYTVSISYRLVSIRLLYAIDLCDPLFV
jgi:hypothetical protein